MYKNTDEYGVVSTLIYGIQWDSVMNWAKCGNNMRDKNTYTATPYEKTEMEEVLLTTGASSEFSKQGIYDLAGNVWEWTLDNYTSVSSYPCVNRGGIYDGDGGSSPASSRGSDNTTFSYDFVGFRVAIY